MSRLNISYLFPIGSKVKSIKPLHTPYNSTLTIIGYDDLSEDRKQAGNYLLDDGLFKMSLPTSDFELISQPESIFVQRIHPDFVEWLHVNIDPKSGDQEQTYVDSIIDATALNSLDDANDWCDIINTAGNPTIGSTVVIKNTDLSRLIEKSYRNLDTLMKELEANGIDTSQLNIIEE